MKYQNKVRLTLLSIVTITVFMLVASMLPGTKENRGSRKSFLLSWDATAGGATPEIRNPFDTAVAATTGYVTGTGADTSKVFFTEDYLMFSISATDTAASEDSVAVTYTLLGASSNQYNRGKIPVWAKFSILGTFTLSAETARDTTWAVYDLLPYGAYEYLYLIATGGAANSKATPSSHLVTIIYDDKD